MTVKLELRLGSLLEKKSHSKKPKGKRQPRAAASAKVLVLAAFERMTKVPELKHCHQEKVSRDSVEKALLRNEETSEFSFYFASWF